MFTYDESKVTKKEFSLIAAGEHKVKILKVTAEKSGAGKPMLKFVLKITEGDDKNRQMFYYLAESDHLQNNIKSLIDSTGVIVPNPGAGSWQGETAIIMVKHETRDNKTRDKVHYFVKDESKTPKLEEPKAALTEESTEDII